MTDTDPKPAILSRETLMPIGLVVACVVPVAIGAMWMRDGMRENQNAIASLRVEMNNRFNALEAKTSDNWRMSDMERWALRFERDNPTVKVPDVRK